MTTCAITIAIMFVASLLFCIFYALNVWKHAGELMQSANEQTLAAWDERQDLRDRLAAALWELRRLRRESDRCRAGCPALGPYGKPPASVAAIYKREPTPDEVAYGLELEREGNPLDVDGQVQWRLADLERRMNEQEGD